MRLKLLPLLLPLAATTSAAGGEEPLPEMVVTATKTEQSVRDVPTAVTVISREEIERSPVTTVDQLLQGVPGVYAARMDPSSPSRIAQTYTRGLPGNSRTLVLLDGVPMNVLYDGQVDWSQLATQDVERVEVVRGASSGLYGANAMGGVINILSRAPDAGTATRLGVDFGSLNSRRLTAAHSVGGADTSFSVSASRFESDGYNMWRPDTRIPAANRAPIGTLKENFTARLLHEIDADRLLEAGVSYLKDEATGFYAPAAPGYIPQTREQYVPSLRYTRDDGETNTSVTLYARYGEQWSDTLTRGYNEIDEKGYYDDRSLGVNAQHTRRLTTTQELTVGADYLDGTIDNHFSYPGSDRRRDTRGDLSRYGLFVQDQLDLTPRWRLNLAGRYDRWESGGNQTDSGAGQPNTNYTTRSDSHFSPKLATLFKLNEHLNLRASAGQAFNLPVMFNLYSTTTRGLNTYWGNPELKPETVDAYDLGLDYYFGHAGHLKATLYRNEASDFIYSVQRSPGGVDFDKVNIGEVVTEGLELEARYRLNERLTFTAGYTLNDSEIVEHGANPALVGMQLTNVPRHQGSLRIDWSPPRGGHLFAAVRHVGDRFGNDANTTVYRGYTVYDLGGDYPIAKGIEARLSWNNITDERYEGIGYLAPGSTVTAAIRAEF